MNLKTQWAQLADREKRMLLAGGIFCIAYLAYLLIFAPISHGISQKKQQVLSKEKLLTWLRGAQQQYHAAHPVTHMNASQILAIITEQLKQSSFKEFPYQLQQSGQGEVQLLFAEVPYNAYMHWVWGLSQRYGTHIQQWQVERGSVDGVVKASITMTTH